MKKLLQARLYHLYKLGGSVQNSARKRVTPIGYLVLLAFPCASSFAVVYARASLIQMMSVFGAVLVIAFFLTWLRNSRIRISRDLPRLASVGEDLVYTVHYENLRSGKLANFLLEELPPDPSPSKELFLGSTEPGEEQRNAFDRTFIAYRWMWLVKQRIFFDSKATVCESVRKGESKHCLMQITPKRRGVIKLSNMRALLPDPLGVFQRIQQVEQSTDHLIVLPKRYRVGDLHLSGSSRNQIGGEALSSISGHAGEFVGLREYRPGDPLRHIHWPSWGKSGKPIVKEYEDVFFPRYGLFLDTVVSAEKANLFEEGVSLAASFACAVDTRECLLDLIFMQQGAKVLTVGRGVAKVENMLETLAGVEIDLKPNWQELEKMILQHTENLTACIAIFCDWSEDRLKMVQKWEAAGLSLLLFYVCDDEKLAREQLKGMAKRFKIAPVDKIQQVLYSL